MRCVLLVLMMLLVGVMPTLAAVQTHVYLQSQNIAVSTEPLGVRVDWAKRVVYVTTTALAPTYTIGQRGYTTARAAAEADARLTIATGVRAIKLTSYATINDAIVTRVLPETILTEISKSLQPVAEAWDPVTRTLKLTCMAPLWGTASLGEYAARMLKIEQKSLAITKLPSTHSKDTMTLRTDRDKVIQISDGPYSGLLLDCTGMKYQPALLPKLVTEEGTEFWGTSGLSPLKVLELGVTGFGATYRDALSANRIGDTPLIIRPVGTCGDLRGDLVISAEDTKLLLEQNAITHFLDNQAIVIALE